MFEMCKELKLWHVSGNLKPQCWMG